MSRFRARTTPPCWAFPLLALVPVWLGCERERPVEQAVPSASPAELAVDRAALATYGAIAHAAYSDAASGARSLLQRVDAFLAAPSAEGLAGARRAWLAARHPYQQTEVFRFYDGPIDAVEMRINTWPIDERFVDGTAASGRLGIIDDPRTYPELSPALLSTLNAKEGETSISTGYHVIEFLLWGTDTHPDGPGDRPYTDYLLTKDERASRRSRYLHAAVEQLLADLETVRDAWAPERPNYRAEFLAFPPVRALGLVLKGMGALSGPELGGERLTVAYETRAQENEHSCFSDNTVSDLADDALGIDNVCAGRYERTSGEPVRGTGLCEAVTAHDRALGERLRENVGASVARLRAIPAPFDRAIRGDDASPGRTAVQAAITALETQTNTLSAIAASYRLRASDLPPRVKP